MTARLMRQDRTIIKGHVDIRHGFYAYGDKLEIPQIFAFTDETVKRIPVYNVPMMFLLCCMAIAMLAGTFFVTSIVAIPWFWLFPVVLTIPSVVGLAYLLPKLRKQQPFVLGRWNDVELIGEPSTRQWDDKGLIAWGNVLQQRSIANGAAQAGRKSSINLDLGNKLSIALILAVAVLGFVVIYGILQK